MTNLLTSLVDRTLERAPVLQRRKSMLFEPPIQEIYAEAQPQVQATKIVSRDVYKHGSEPQAKTASTISPPETKNTLVTVVEPHVLQPPSTPQPEPHEEPAVREQFQATIVETAPPQSKPSISPQLETIVERKVEREVVIEKIIDSNPKSIAEVPTQSQPSAPIRVLAQQPVAPSPTTHPPIQTPRIKSAEPRVATRQQTQRAATRLKSQLPSQSDPPAPTINVTIGRVEVRASTPSKRAEPTRAAAPKLSLEDYLQGRSKGK